MMTTDLRDALRSMHEDARRGAPELSAGPLVTLARRRRALVRTGYSVAGIGTAAAVALAGVGLGGRLEQRPAPPAPAATTTAPAPTPSTTATPAPTLSSTPSSSPSTTAPAAFRPDLQPCGTAAPDPISGDFEAFGLEAWSTDVGGSLLTHYQVMLAGAPGDKVSAGPVAAVLVDPGQLSGSGQSPRVVGVAAQPMAGPSPQVLTAAPEAMLGPGAVGVELPVSLSFVMCPGLKGAGGPPPAGSYVAWTEFQVVQDGHTRSAWGPASGTVGPTPTPTAGGEVGVPPARAYLPAGTVRLDSHSDQSLCGTDPHLSSDTWTPTTGAVTGQASAALDGGNLVVRMHLNNTGAAVNDVEVRYPSYYVVNDSPIPNPYTTDPNAQPFAAGRVMHTGNIGVATTSGAASLGGPTPSWTPRTVLAGGGSLDLETSVGPYTCTTAWGTTWPSGSYTIYAFTDLVLPDGTTTSVQAAPVRLTVP